MADLTNAQIFLPGGKRIRASEVSKITLENGEAQVERENLQLMVPITARLDNRDLGSAMAEIQQAMNRDVHLPQGYHITYGGAYKEQQQSFKELQWILLSASLLVFTVLLFLFGDLRVALLMLALAVIGVTGCILALWLTNTALNVGSYTGIIMIIGIIGENAIFTFLQFKHNREHQGRGRFIGLCDRHSVATQADDRLGCHHRTFSHRTWHRYGCAIASTLGHSRDRRLCGGVTVVAGGAAEYVAVAFEGKK